MCLAMCHSAGAGVDDADFLQRNPDGLHIQHIAFRTEDVDAAMAELRRRGFEEVHGGNSPTGRYGYFTHPLQGDFCIEISGQNARSSSTAASAPTVALALDTGASSSDGITNIGTVNVSGLIAGNSWEYSIDGGTTWTAGAIIFT